MWLNLVLLFLFGWFSHKLARRIFKSWWSPVTIYFAIWLLLIALYTLRLLRYPPLHIETWVALWTSFLTFWLGVMTPVFATQAVGRKERCTVTGRGSFADFVKRRARFLKQIILILCALSFIAVIGQFAVLMRQYGGVGSVIASIGAIRYDYTTGRLDFGILDYIAMLPFTATIFSGCYLAIVSMRSPIPYFPVVAIIAWALPLTARMNILWGLLLLFNSFALCKVLAGRPIVTLSRRLFLALGGLVLLVAILFNLLWQARIGDGEYPLFLKLASPEFLRVRERLVGNSKLGSVLFGSLVSDYAYFTLHLAHLNFYLHETLLHGSKPGDSLTGAGSFAAVWRAARKLGLTNIEAHLTGAGDCSGLSCPLDQALILEAFTMILACWVL